MYKHIDFWTHGSGGTDKDGRVNCLRADWLVAVCIVGLRQRPAEV